MRRADIVNTLKVFITATNYTSVGDAIPASESYNEGMDPEEEAFGGDLTGFFVDNGTSGILCQRIA
jgi:hypothetical protein